MIGRVAVGLNFRDGATVTIEVEKDVVGSTTTKDGGKYSITFAHPGTFKATASFPGFRDSVKEPARETRKIRDRSNFSVE